LDSEEAQPHWGLLRYRKTKNTTQFLLSASTVISSNNIQWIYSVFDIWFKRWSQKTLRLNSSWVFSCVGPFTPIFSVNFAVTSHTAEIILALNSLDCLVLSVVQPQRLSAQSAESTYTLLTSIQKLIF